MGDQQIREATLNLMQLLYMDTRAEVQALRKGPRKEVNGVMANFLEALREDLTCGWISRKRIRHLSLQFLNNGQL